MESIVAFVVALVAAPLFPAVILKIKALLADDELKKYTGAGSNQKRFVVSRIEYVRDSVS